MIIILAFDFPSEITEYDLCKFVLLEVLFNFENEFMYAVRFILKCRYDIAFCFLI